MIKVEAETLEIAYSKAAKKLECSITQLKIEVVQAPSSGFLGFFKKQAIIVVIKDFDEESKEKIIVQKTPIVEEKTEEVEVKEIVQKEVKKETVSIQKDTKVFKKPKKSFKKKALKEEKATYNDIIMPASFVTDQEEDDYDGSDLYEDEEDEVYVGAETEICNKSHDEIYEQLVTKQTGISNSSANDNFFQNSQEKVTYKPSDVADEIKEKVDALFKFACFDIDEIKVAEHDENTILVEFSGKDAALLIGKEGYRYKALSYMLYNWINATYQLQLRLEIAEFLKNQEEMIGKYLEGVRENIDKDGRAQTKILDGVLVQIALRELRLAYPDKYVAIRSTRDGAKFIIINSFNNNNNNY